MKTASPNILILLPLNNRHRSSFETLIRNAQPDVAIRTVFTIEDAREAIGDADAFMAFGVAVTEDIFVKATNLRWVHALGTGVDGIVDRPGLNPEVVVTATRGIHGPPLSEIAILHMLALARDFPRSVRAQGRHAWDRFPAKLLCQQTVGILGVGQIALALAPRLKALGMKVVGITRTKREDPGFDRFESRDDLLSAVADLDYLVLLAPLEPDTRRIVNEKTLGSMKRGAYLINIARGGLVDEAALIDALKSGQLAGAALDTVEREPLPPEDPLWEAPNLIITAHLGGYYDTYVEDCIDQILFNLREFRAGRPHAMNNREVRRLKH